MGDIVEVHAYLVSEDADSYVITADPDGDEDTFISLPKALTTHEGPSEFFEGEPDIQVFSIPEWLALDREIETVNPEGQ